MWLLEAHIENHEVRWGAPPSPAWDSGGGQMSREFPAWTKAYIIAFDRFLEQSGEDGDPDAKQDARERMDAILYENTRPQAGVQRSAGYRKKAA